MYAGRARCIDMTDRVLSSALFASLSQPQGRVVRETAISAGIPTARLRMLSGHRRALNRSLEGLQVLKPCGGSLAQGWKLFLPPTRK